MQYRDCTSAQRNGFTKMTPASEGQGVERLVAARRDRVDVGAARMLRPATARLAGTRTEGAAVVAGRAVVATRGVAAAPGISERRDQQDQQRQCHQNSLHKSPSVPCKRHTPDRTTRRSATGPHLPVTRSLRLPAGHRSGADPEGQGAAVVMGRGVVKGSGIIKVKEPHTLRARLICSLIAVALGAYVVLNNIPSTMPLFLERAGPAMAVLVINLIFSVKSWRQLVQAE